ncbi:hypothetical protein ThvES_00007760 [Thiovulum sp. ES]|nr:hypothetical protein ThvES_00007760 [Thiovulum sp. ES]
MSIFNYKLSNTLATIMFGTALTFTGCGSDDDDDTTPTTEVETGENTEVETGENTEVETGENTEVETGENTEVETGENTEVETGENTEVETGENTEVETGENTEVETGENTETETEVETGENTETETEISSNGYEFSQTAIQNVSGEITEDTTWTNDKVWQLSGSVNVIAPAVLTIEAGTVVTGANGADYLAINTGAKIHAEGTAESPIIFTSLQDLAGQGAVSQWGGLTILGNAQSNKGTSVYEAGTQNFASESADANGESSGVLKYVQIKYTGFEVEADKELNGLSLAGVGSGTEIDHIEVYVGGDDGIELWGGTANLSHVAIIGAGDDSLDWTDGWTGTADHVYIHQTENVTSDDPRGIEADSNGDNPTLEPISNPTISNMTIVADDENAQQGILLRRGTSASISNSIVVGSREKSCLEFRDSATLDTQPIFENVVLGGGCSAHFGGDDGVEADGVQNQFEAGTNNSVSDEVDPMAIAQSYEGDDYIGAFDPNAESKWTDGWTHEFIQPKFVQ